MKISKDPEMFETVEVNVNKALRSLKRRAVKACRLRGHEMSRFTRNQFKTSIATSECLHCKKYVQVMVYPLPNEIHIGGNALALQCN